MTTDNTYKIFFGSNGCLSLKGYRGVIAGELSGKALDDVNAHLESCELCHETLEGLRQNPDDTAVLRAVESLTGKIAPVKTVIRPMYFVISAAAVLLFAIGLGYQAFKNNEDKEMDKAFAEEFKPYEAPSGKVEEKLFDGGISAPQPELNSKSVGKKKIENAMDDLSVVTEGQLSQPAQPIYIEDSKNGFAEDETKALPGEADLDAVTITDKFSPTQGNYPSSQSSPTYQRVMPAPVTQNAPLKNIERAEKTRPKNSDYNYDIQTTESENLKEVTVTSKSRRPQKVTSEKKATQKENAAEEKFELFNAHKDERSADSTIVSNMAMDSYRAGDYARAAKLFDELLTSDPMRNEARFFGGISWLESGNAKKAESYFRNLISTPGHAFAYPAKWYLALALIKQKNKKEALVILDQLSSVAGEYQQRAQDLTATLR